MESTLLTLEYRECISVGICLRSILVLLTYNNLSQFTNLFLLRGLEGASRGCLTR